MQMIVETDGSYESVDDRLDRSMTNIESKFSKLDSEFSKVEKLLDEIDELLKNGGE